MAAHTDLAERPGEAARAVAAEAVHQVLAEAAVAGAAGALVQLQLAVPAPEAPRADALVAVNQVLRGGRAAGGPLEMTPGGQP